MIEMNNELITAMRKFKDVFGDIVPLRELPADTTNEDIIKAVNESLSANKNLLPERFGYQNLNSNLDTLI